MSVNIPEPAQEFDPFASASNPAVQTYDLFGMVEINAWACALVKGAGKVPFDPNNPAHKRFTAIDVFIQPLPEIDVKYPKTCEEHWVAEFPEWAKITLPSIKTAGYENVREINGKWARVARVPNGKKYQKKDKDGNLLFENGNPVMADETTFKFIAFYNTEDECRIAYLAAGGKPMTNAPINVPATVENTERQTALAFLKVIVSNAAKGKADFVEAMKAVDVALTQYPTVSKYFNGKSIETGQLITEATGHLPF